MPACDGELQYQHRECEHQQQHQHHLHQQHGQHLHLAQQQRQHLQQQGEAEAEEEKEEQQQHEEQKKKHQQHQEEEEEQQQEQQCVPRRRHQQQQGASSSRNPRVRKSSKHGGPKKQPQRGLGVAQLEKLRLEEQQQEEEAIALAQRRGARPLRLSRCLASGIGHGMEKPLFPLLSNLVCQDPPRLGAPLRSGGKMNFPNAPHSYAHLAGSMADATIGRRQSFVPVALLSQLAVEDSEPCHSSLSSQAHDLCSPTSGVSTSAISLGEHSVTDPAFQPDKARRYSRREVSLQATNLRLGCHSNLPANAALLSNGLMGQAQFGERARQIQDSERNMDTVMDRAMMPAALCPMLSGAKEQGIVGGQKPGVETNRGSVLPFTELHPFDPSLGPPDSTNSSRSRMEWPVVSLSTTGVQPMELSSFQNFPMNQRWSSEDQISSRKRPWVYTQEPTRNLDFSKSVDLYASFAENEQVFSEQNSSSTSLATGNGASRIPSIYRYALSSSSVPSLKTGSFSSTSPESTESLLTSGKIACFDSVSEGNPSKMQLVPSVLKDVFSTSVGVSKFLNLRKGSMNYEASSKVEAGISNDFLTLGVSSSLTGMNDQLTLGTVSHSHCLSISPADSSKVAFHTINGGNIWQIGGYLEQGKSSDVRRVISVVQKTSSRDLLVETDENVQFEQPASSLQLNVGLPSLISSSKFEADFAQQKGNTRSAEEDSLDLDLRLSL